MNKKSFIKILQQPESLTDKELNFVREINIEYPFFQASKVIELKYLKKVKDIKFKKHLRTAAAFTKNREVLFDFINDIQNQNEKIYFNKNEIKKVLNESPILEKDQKIEYNSFVDWLELTNIKPIDRKNQTKKIDDFISKEPKIKVNTDSEEESIAHNKSAHMNLMAFGSPEKRGIPTLGELHFFSHSRTKMWGEDICSKAAASALTSTPSSTVSVATPASLSFGKDVSCL